MTGLSTHEAQQRLDQYGPNRLPVPPVSGITYLFLRQFLSPFIYILLIATVVSFLLAQLPSAIFILVVLLLNAAIGTAQEYSAERSAAALRNIVKGVAHVIRDGTAQKIDVDQLVPDDVVLLSSGNKVPADLTLHSAQSLAVDESMLTGESLAVSKNADQTVAKDALLGDRFNQCFAGTIVTHGRAQGIVTATGLNTEIGKIATDVGQERVSEPPLMIRIRRFTYQVAVAILISILLLVGIMLLRGSYDAEGMLLMAIGLAVSTIPEGLPAALTVALAIGMRRMVRKNVIIRKLLAVEALGSCTFICSDKTGTLTVNELTIRKIILPGDLVFDVSGEGVTPGGSIQGNGDTEHVRELCKTGVLANESQLDYAGGEWVSDGDIVDVAFLVLAKKLGLSLSTLRKQQTQLDLLPYESERAFSGSLNVSVSGQGVFLYVKGSPEKMLQLSDKMLVEGQAVPIDRDKIQHQFITLAEKGYRVLALAQRTTQSKEIQNQLEEMTFLGLVAMIDPVRAEAYDAVKRCREGGIEIAMVTGDHPATAKAIAMDLDLCGESDLTVTGAMIRETVNNTPDKLDNLTKNCRVFARIEPHQKELIVESFIHQGHFVAVTGDGVNDAPAMHAAHAGIAMGKRGSDVARESADIIITDDNFASIVDGIEQGRIVYNNIRKVIALLIATGFSALLLFLCTALAGLPMPMIAVQLLWLNLIANGMQDVALAFEPKEGGELAQPPRTPKEPIFDRHIIEHVILIGSYMGGVAFMVYAYLMISGVPIAESRNLVLMLMVLFGNIHALNSRSETRSIFKLSLLSNGFLICAVPLAQLLHIGAMYTPGLSNVLQIQPISLNNWGVLLLIALSLLVVEELHKAWSRARHAKAALRSQATITSSI